MQENLVINPPEPVLVPVIGGGLFPVRRVYCVGRNYAAHAIEMGGDTRDVPFFFQKPASAIVLNGSGTDKPRLKKQGARGRLPKHLIYRHPSVRSHHYEESCLDLETLPCESMANSGSRQIWLI